MEPHTLATAINIGNPASYERAVRAIRDTNGVVTTVSDAEILEAKAVVDGAGIGCEPASAATLDRKGLGSKKVMFRVAVRPSLRSDQNSFLPMAPGATTPMPVMTIRWLGISARVNVVDKGKIAKCVSS